MHWVASSEKDSASAPLQKRLWDPADQFRANSAFMTSAPLSGASARRSPTSTPPASATTLMKDKALSSSRPVHNKLHGAITGQTAAGIIHPCADSARPNMGLTTWRSAKVRQDDVVIANNYLDEPELGILINLVQLTDLVTKDENKTYSSSFY